MPLNLDQGNVQYTVLNTAGTTTLNQGQGAIVQGAVGYSGKLPATYGVLYGTDTIDAGTSFAYTLYDIIQPSGLGTDTAITTNTLMNGTDTKGSSRSAGVSGVGMRYRGALVAVTSGTPGIVNVAHG